MMAGETELAMYISLPQHIQADVLDENDSIQYTYLDAVISISSADQVELDEA